MKKLIAAFIGTAVLVTLGCGTAMLVGCNAAAGCGYILTALAFGLVIVGMAYCVGNISGCHINPAVSLGVLMSKGMSVKEFFGYAVRVALHGNFGPFIQPEEGPDHGHQVHDGIGGQKGRGAAPDKHRADIQPPVFFGCGLDFFFQGQ